MKIIKKQKQKICKDLPLHADLNSIGICKDHFNSTCSYTYTPRTCHSRYIPSARVAADIHTQFRVRDKSAVFCVSTEMRLTISPTVAEARALADSRKAQGIAERNGDHSQTLRICIFGKGSKPHTSVIYFSYFVPPLYMYSICALVVLLPWYYACILHPLLCVNRAKQTP